MQLTNPVAFSIVVFAPLDLACKCIDSIGWRQRERRPTQACGLGFTIWQAPRDASIRSVASCEL
jgi:hypothetical protein